MWLLIPIRRAILPRAGSDRRALRVQVMPPAGSSQATEEEKGWLVRAVLEALERVFAAYLKSQPVLSSRTSAPPTSRPSTSASAFGAASTNHSWADHARGDDGGEPRARAVEEAGRAAREPRLRVQHAHPPARPSERLQARGRRRLCAAGDEVRRVSEGRSEPERATGGGGQPGDRRRRPGDRRHRRGGECAHARGTRRRKS